MDYCCSHVTGTLSHKARRQAEWSICLDELFLFTVPLPRVKIMVAQDDQVHLCHVTRTRLQKVVHIQLISFAMLSCMIMFWQSLHLSWYAQLTISVFISGQPYSQYLRQICKQPFGEIFIFIYLFIHKI